MTHFCCPGCRLRFTPAPAAAALSSCPHCGELPQASSLRDTFGFRIVKLEDIPRSLPEAVAVSLAVPDPDSPRIG